MQKNIGNTDRAIRLVLGLIIVILGIVYQSWWGLAGLVPLLTALLAYCPLYTIIGVTTCSNPPSTDKPGKTGTRMPKP
ncbi:MAG: DUF2892 domain-containing protein [Chlorobium phaeobacteroides]|jgi:hypothetical protein|nr:DUF2892 domain-containing protein [Chlorobium phaeobacteroides]